MASFSFTINYPDAVQPRVMAALKKHWTTLDEDGNPVVPTNAQVGALVKEMMKERLKALVLRVETEAVVKPEAVDFT